MRVVVRLGFFVCLLFGSGTAYGLDYRVERGDTLSRIAQRFGVTVAAIKRANDLRSDMIITGEVLKIPSDDDDTSDRSDLVHVVRSGESLSLIAVRYRVLVRDIRRANGITGDLIHPGQRIVIPDDDPLGRDAAPAPASRGAVHPPMRASQADLEVLARIVKGECPPSVPFVGKVAVAAVVLNRVRSRSFPSTIPGVAHQRKQFSCYNPDVRRRLYWGRIPPDAWAAARAALRGEDPTAGSLFYFNPYIVRPRWARDMTFVTRIGARPHTTHDFYRPEGVDAPRPRSSGLAGALPR